MIFVEQKIPGVFVIEPQPIVDERGIFRRHFCAEEFRMNHIASEIKQCNVSENRYRYTLRGFHYQLDPYGEGKTFSCFRGAIYDIVVDLRPASPSYLSWISLELIDNKKSIHVPSGCANAFLTLEEDTIIHYYCSEFYNPSAERGIRYNDPLFKFEWPSEPRVISDKDGTHPDFVP